MKILFSNLPWWSNDNGELRQGIRAGSRWPFTRHAAHEPDNFRFGGYLPTPFFLQYAASYTQREFQDAKVILRDSIARGESYSGFMAWVTKWQPDWIVIETATPSWEHDEKAIRLLAHQLPEARVILCGPMDAAKHEGIFDAHPNVSAIVQGEPDKQITKVIKGHTRLCLSPEVYPHDLLTTSEMNAAPLPMWDDACATHYWDGCPVGHQPPQLQIWTSRGCPHKCNFCSWPAVMTGNDPDGTRARSVRCYSADYLERLLQERVEWGQKHGTPYKSAYDDSDTANLVDRHTRVICGVYKNAGLPWSAMCRADTSSPEVWQLMKDSGCFGVKIGMESASQRVIDQIINKKLNIKKAIETCKWLRGIGMSVHTTWSIGHPGETAEERQQTVDLIRRMYDEGCHDTHQLSGTATIEGTPLAKIAAGARLEKYPGAVSDGFLITGDGQAKIEGMTK